MHLLILSVCESAEQRLQQDEPAAEPMEVEAPAADSSPEPAAPRADSTIPESATEAADSALARAASPAASRHTEEQAVQPLVQYSGESVSQLSMGECTAEGVLQQEVAQVPVPHVQPAHPMSDPARDWADPATQQQEAILSADNQTQVC